MKVMIVGGGIAGLALAWFLDREGHEAQVIERAPRLRTEGYMIDFFGSGYDVAEHVGLLPDLEAAHYAIPHFTFLAPDGAVRFTLPYPRLRALVDGRHLNFLRGDLERALFRRVEGAGRVRFGVTVRAVEQGVDGVRVTLDDGSTHEADLLVGADGLHSRVRDDLLGNGGRAERFLGYHTAAYILDDPPDLGIRPETFYTLTEPGRQVTVYPLRGGRLAAFFIHRAAEPVRAVTRERAQGLLRETYAGMRWVVPRLLDLLGRVEDLYYDDVAQVALPAWRKGRVALVGDACQCASLLAGQGASMALAGAWVLARELARSKGDVVVALARYEQRVKPHVARMQEGGRRMARWFVPESHGAIAARDLATRMATWPVLAPFARSRFAMESMFPRRDVTLG